MIRKKCECVYGPVPSWRLGRSLGIDSVYTGKDNACSFDCIYCQAGRTYVLTDKRRVFVPTSEIIEKINALPPVEIDYITFSGAGEPTLAENLGEIIKEIRKIRKEKIAVLTNSSLIDREDVRRDLLLADFVIAKLDAHKEDLFLEIDRPVKTIKFDDIVKGLKDFKKGFEGRFALQIMFIEENKKYAKEIAHLARQINPDEIQINTPLRACGVKPLPRKYMDEIKKFFEGTSCSNVYDSKKKDNA